VPVASGFASECGSDSSLAVLVARTSFDSQAGVERTQTRARSTLPPKSKDLNA